MLIVFRGLPGTGKSHLVRQLLERRPGHLVLSRDTLRVAIVRDPDFSDAEKALVDDLIVAMADHLLARGRTVIIDGMVLSSAQRLDAFVKVADTNGVPCRIVECTCSEATALERIGADADTHPAGDRGAALYHAVKARYEPSPHPVLMVDTERDTDRTIAAIPGWIDSTPP